MLRTYQTSDDRGVSNDQQVLLASFQLEDDRLNPDCG
jgi:hypothetical protein